MVADYPAGEPIWTVFDGIGRVISVIDGHGNATTRTCEAVDAKGLLDIMITDALSRDMTEAHDAAGWTRASTDQFGQVTSPSFAWDGDGDDERDGDCHGMSGLAYGRHRRGLRRSEGEYTPRAVCRPRTTDDRVRDASRSTGPDRDRIPARVDQAVSQRLSCQHRPAGGMVVGMPYLGRGFGHCSAHSACVSTFQRV
jgi:hypothetical protein